MPPTWDPLNDDPVTGDTIPVAFLELEGRTVELRKGFAGATPPANPQEGMVWVDTGQIPHRVFRYLRIDGGNAAWQPVGPLSRLPGSINGDPSLVDDRIAPFEYKAFRLENRNGLPAPSPTNAGMVVYRMADGEVWYADQPVSGGWKGLLSVTAGASLDSVEVDLTSAVLGGTPPTVASKGTTPAVRGYLFDAAGESLTLHVVVPQNFHGAGDLFLDLDCVINQAEGVGDDIDWSADLVAVSPGPSGGAATKTGTVVVPGLTDIGANSGDGALHRCRLTLDHDAVDNPITPGALLAIEIHRTDLAEVGGVILVAARVGYPQRVRHERA
jgi:hypothetical protein